MKLTISTILMLIFFVSFSQNKKLIRLNEKIEDYDLIKVREKLLKRVEKGDKSAYVYSSIADTYYKNGQYEESANWYEKLKDEYPDEVTSEDYLNLANSYKDLKKYDNSKSAFYKYAELEPSSSIAQDFLSNPNYITDLSAINENYDLQKVEFNSMSSDFGASFPNDSTLVYATTNNSQGSKTYNWTGEGYLDLYKVSINGENEFGEPKPIQGDVNTRFHESSAAFTKDGNTMYFTRNNYDGRKKRLNSEKTILLKIYKAIKENGKWINVTELPFNSNDYSVANPALNNENDKLYFSSDMDGGIGSSDIWYVNILENDSYSEPINLGSKINTEERETFPFISSKDVLYYSSNGKMGLGGLDLFKAVLSKDGEVITVKNLKAPINSNADDFSFAINTKNNLGIVSSNRDGNKGSSSDEIYRLHIKENPVLKGKVAAIEIEDILEDKIIFLEDNMGTKIDSLQLEKEGDFAFQDNIKEGEKYVLIVEAEEGVTGIEKEIIAEDKNEDVNLFVATSDCPEGDLNCILKLNPIYFDLDKSLIREDAEEEITKVSNVLFKYPDLKIHIESHTDSRASKTYNINLSEARAKSTRDWLIEKGIEPDRLTAKGYGESQLVNKCKDGVKCSEQQHQQNRRSIFKVAN